MAKAKINKSKVIREALAAHRDKGPTEISAILKTQGHKIEPSYVSVVKASLGAKKKGRKRKAKRTADGKVGTRSVFAAVGAAVEFVKAAGGIVAAKEALGTVEMIGKVVG